MSDILTYSWQHKTALMSFEKENPLKYLTSTVKLCQHRSIWQFLLHDTHWNISQTFCSSVFWSSAVLSCIDRFPKTHLQTFMACEFSECWLCLWFVPFEFNIDVIFTRSTWMIDIYSSMHFARADVSRSCHTQTRQEHKLYLLVLNELCVHRFGIVDD